MGQLSDIKDDQERKKQYQRDYWAAHKADIIKKRKEAPGYLEKRRQYERDRYQKKKESGK